MDLAFETPAMSGPFPVIVLVEVRRLTFERQWRLGGLGLMSHSSSLLGLK
jgi:hypothetical protein